MGMNSGFKKIFGTVLISGLIVYAGAVTCSKNVDISESVDISENVNNVAVLVVDMQDHYLADVAEEELAEEQPYQIKVLEYCNKNNIPVFILEYEGRGKTTEIIRDNISDSCLADSVTKSYSNGFYKTNLEEKLEKANIGTVLLMGVYGSRCVKGTALGALESNFNIMTSKQLIAEDASELGLFTDDEIIEWYERRGIYRDNYLDLLQIITDGTIEENLPGKTERVLSGKIRIPKQYEPIDKEVLERALRISS
jgi:isochorismate hydrolase